MLRSLVLAGMLFGVAFASGCQRSERAETQAEPEAVREDEPAPAPHAQRPESTSRQPKTRVTDGIPTEEDYEAEAAALITPATLEAELAKLEAEVTPK